MGTYAWVMSRYNPHGITDAFECMVCGEWQPLAETAMVVRPARRSERSTHSIGWRITYCRNNPDCSAWANAEGPWHGRPARTPDPE